MQAYIPNYSGQDESAAEQFRRIADILQGFRPVFISPTLLNSWANYGSGYEAIGYYKDLLGRIHLRGLMTGGASGSVAFTLPVSYRPNARLAFAGTTSNAGILVATEIDVLANGDVRVFDTSGGLTYAIGLDGISFVAEQ